MAKRSAAAAPDAAPESGRHVAGTPKGFEPVRRSKLYEQVVSRVVDAILAGEHPPGSLLPSEDELRQRYGVGRLAVREALLALERLGITAFVPGIGIQVVVPTPAQLMDGLDPGVLHYLAHSEGGHTQLREVRRAIEVDIVRLATGRASSEDVTAIEATLRQGERCIDDRARYLEADRAFHLAIGVAAGNPVFAALQAAIRRWIEGYPATRVHVPGSDARSHEDHLGIFRAIKAGNAQEAAARMATHLAVDYSFEGKLRRIRGRRPDLRSSASEG
jgi:DNA-binding FadR family transcriptional regulator